MKETAIREAFIHLSKPNSAVAQSVRKRALRHLGDALMLSISEYARRVSKRRHALLVKTLSVGQWLRVTGLGPCQYTGLVTITKENGRKLVKFGFTSQFGIRYVMTANNVIQHSDIYK